MTINTEAEADGLEDPVLRGPQGADRDVVSYAIHMYICIYIYVYI